MIKKIASVSIAAILILALVANFSACSLKDIFSSNDNDSDNADSFENYSNGYAFDFLDAGKGECVISNLRFDPDSPAPEKIEFPSKSYDGKTVTGIKFLTEADILPQIMRGEDMEILFDTVEENIEKAISEGKVKDAKFERGELVKLKACYVRYCLDDAVSQDMRNEWADRYPMLLATKSIYVFDSESIDAALLKRVTNVVKKYGVDIEFIAESNRTLYEEIMNSTMFNKVGATKMISGYNAVKYPESVKELVFTDLTYDPSNALTVPTVERLTLGTEEVILVDISAMPDLKQITTSNVMVTVKNCSSLKQVDFTGERVYLSCSGGMSGVKAIVHDSVSRMGSSSVGLGAKDGLYGDAIEEIILPNTLEQIYLGSVAETGYYKSLSNWNKNALYIGNYLIEVKNNVATDYTIKEGTLAIGDKAFTASQSLMSITIPSSVKFIGTGAFEALPNLKTVTLENGVEYIGDKAFAECAALLSIDIPKSVSEISATAFTKCKGLNTITVDSENAVYEAKGNCIIDKNTKTLILGCKNSTIPSDAGITSIGERAFEDCSELTSVTIPNTVTEIGADAFEGCAGLESIVIPDSVIKIRGDAFKECSALESVMIGSGATNIDYTAFSKCINLESIVVDEKNAKYESKGNCLINKEYKTLMLGCKTSQIPSDGSVIVIGNSAFEGCVGLMTITIPDSVKSIGNSAFADCHKLIEIVNNSTLNIKAGEYRKNGQIAAYAKDVHSGVSNLTPADQNGFVFFEHNGVNYLLGYEGDEKNIVLPESYNGGKYKVYRYAFAGNKNITGLTITSGVTEIDGYAFMNCVNLEYVIIEEDVSDFDMRSSAFEGCDTLTDVVIKSSAIEDAGGFFNNCSNLTNITFADISQFRYLSKSNIKNIVILGGDKISGDELRYCSMLESVTIPVSVVLIGRNQFKNCDKLQVINYMGTEEQWNAIEKMDPCIPEGVTINYNYVIE